MALSDVSPRRPMASYARRKLVRGLRPLQQLGGRPSLPLRHTEISPTKIYLQIRSAEQAQNGVSFVACPSSNHGTKTLYLFESQHSDIAADAHLVHNSMATMYVSPA
jgi:hypothetical protein